MPYRRDKKFYLHDQWTIIFKQPDVFKAFEKTAFKTNSLIDFVWFFSAYVFLIFNFYFFLGPSHF